MRITASQASGCHFLAWGASTDADSIPPPLQLYKIGQLTSPPATRSTATFRHVAVAAGQAARATDETLVGMAKDIGASVQLKVVALHPGGWGDILAFATVVCPVAGV